MLGTTLLQHATRALRAPLARPCLCRSSLPSSSSSTSSLPSSSSTLVRLVSSSAPTRHHLLSSSLPSRTTTTSPFQRAPSSPLLAPGPTAAAHPLGQTRTFKMPKCVKRRASPVARNGGAGKAARKHSARAAKRRRQRSKKIN
ncbi:hypothetical protein JCM8208_001308 [Rhodotorula glutinis]